MYSTFAEREKNMGTRDQICREEKTICTSLARSADRPLTNQLLGKETIDIGTAAGVQSRRESTRQSADQTAVGKQESTRTTAVVGSAVG